MAYPNHPIQPNYPNGNPSQIQYHSAGPPPGYYTPANLPQTYQAQQYPIVQVLVPQRPLQYQHEQPQVYPPYHRQQSQVSLATPLQQPRQQLPTPQRRAVPYPESSSQRQKPLPSPRSQLQVQTPQVVVHKPGPLTLDGTVSPAESRQKSNHAASVPPAPETPVDFQVLLLSLAEECIAAAHGMSATLARTQDDAEVERYYQLLATGMGCMESALNRFKLQPRAEATLRLRYANLLHEETSNEMAAEAVLTKGIALAERSRLLDLQYSMQHLMARILFTSKPRVALILIDKLIPDVEAYQQTSWVYAFRFLRVSLSLQLTSHPDVNAALQQLRSIASLAESKRHVSVCVVTAALEAMMYLRNGATDSIELAQRAIASARSHQFEDEVAQIPQVMALLDCLDLACSLQQFNPDQASSKMHTMQVTMDRVGKSDGWREDGSFAVPTGSSNGPDSAAQTGGIFEQIADGKDALVFRWLRRSDLYSLAYFLSGIAALNKNATDFKAEKYLYEGAKLTNESHKAPEEAAETLLSATARQDWRNMMNYQMRLQLVFALCSREEWTYAQKLLAELPPLQSRLTPEHTASVLRVTDFLRGVIEQGIGNTEAALQIYQSGFPLPSVTTKTSASITHHELAIVASLNSLLIIRMPSHPQQSQAETLLKALEPLCLSHPNRSFASAFHMLRGLSTASFDSSTPSLPIIKRKQFLQSSLAASKSVNNTQLLTMAMNYMNFMFFKNIVGEQAEKSATTGRTLAKRGRSRLWTAVADGMVGETMERCGKLAEAQEARDEGRRVLEQLPATLKRKFEEETADHGPVEQSMSAD
ncbi:hypothetical protein LTR66_002873 [Elasticomyces elasticus]|nr:hypothetical protein LTR66_002873 [Elasticomyces elasticus]